MTTYINGASPIQTQVSTENLSRNTSSFPFQTTLKTEEAKLEERTKYLSLIAPWSQVERMFRAIPLDFDFGIKVSKIENNLHKEIERNDINVWKTEIKNKNSIPFQSSEIQGEAKEKALEVLFLKNGLAMGDVKLIPVFENIMLDLRGKISTLDINNLVDRIIEKIKLMRAQGKIELELALKPEHLGRLRLNISVDKGIVSIRFLASPEAKEILESNLAKLKESLNEAKVSIGSLEVEISRDSKPDVATLKENAGFENLGFGELKTKEDHPVYIDPKLLKYIGWISENIYSEA